MDITHPSEIATSTILIDGSDTSDNSQSVSALNTQDQMLFNAIQDFFVPLIRKVVDGREANVTDLMAMAPEAIKLISALKEFISTIVGSSAPEEKTTVRVVSDSATDNGEKGQYIADSQMTRLMIPVNPQSLSQLNPHIERIKNSWGAPSPPSRQRLFGTLREHVFNKMPIRLLCLKPKTYSLEIRLIERASIYTHLEKEILAIIDTPSYRNLTRKMFRLQTKSYETDEDVIERIISKYAGYAILSHTWLRDASEITYNDWKNGQFSTDVNGPGYDKLTNFCEIAWQDHGLTLAWMDTLCINKESSSELDESIRSMYAWYKRAKICIVYLANSKTRTEISVDPWFTRGWTLQELLAPDAVKFYNCHWKPFARDLNDKEDPAIIEFITQATQISSEELKDIHHAPLSRRMQLSANRHVTRKEDIAYSLMGIFNVSFTTAYGEGAERAFSRLLQEILGSTSQGALDLMNWAGRVPGMARTTNIFPPTPQHYLHRTTSISLNGIRPLEPLALTHMGLRIPVMLLPGLILNPRHEPKSIGNYWAQVTVNIPSDFFAPTFYTHYLLDVRIRESITEQDFPSTHRAFAVFNIRQGANGIVLPRTCIAILLECSQNVGKVTSTGEIKKLHTSEPVVFNIEKNDGKFGEGQFDGEEIPVDELAIHGMQLVSLYL